MNETLGERVERLRKIAGMGQKELGRIVGRSESWVSNVESGKISEIKVGQAVAMADALGVTLDELQYGRAEVATPREAPIQLALVDANESVDIDAVVAYVESRPGKQFQERLQKQRDRLQRADYIRFCVGLFRAWSSNSDLALTSVELSGQP